MSEYSQYYDLEKYLFEEVAESFKVKGFLNSFNFFCIIIWKANRAKSKIAHKLLRKYPDLETASRELTGKISKTTDDKERLRILLAEGFRLPMASAILSVLYQDKYTVYDIRVCEQLGKFKNLAEQKDPVDVYFDFVQEVRKFGPSLREADKEIWGKSFAQQLKTDIHNKFEASK